MVPRRKINPLKMVPTGGASELGSLTARRSLAGHRWCDPTENHGKKGRDAPVGNVLTPSPPSISLSLTARMPTQLLHALLLTAGTCLCCISHFFSQGVPFFFQKRQKENEGKHLFLLFDHMVDMQPYHICPIRSRRTMWFGNSERMWLS